MICKRCFRMSDDDAKRCPYCGESFTDEPEIEEVPENEKISETEAGQDTKEEKAAGSEPKPANAPAVGNEYRVPQGTQNPTPYGYPGYGPNYGPGYGNNNNNNNNYNNNYNNYQQPYIPRAYVYTPIKREPTPAGKFFSAIWHAALYLALFFMCQIIVSVGFVMSASFGASMSIMSEYLDRYGDSYEIPDAVYNEMQDRIEEAAYEALENIDLNLINVISSAITILIVLLIAAIKHRPISEHIGFYPAHSWKILLLFPAAVALQFLVTMIINVIPWPAEAVDQFNNQYSFIGQSPLWIDILSTAIMAPVVEEIIFRGCIYTRLRRGMPAAAAVIISAVVFGAMHGSLIAFSYATLLGFVLVYAYEKFGTLIAPIVVHAGFNGANYILAPFLTEDTTDLTVIILLAVSAVVFIACSAVVILSDVKKKNTADDRLPPLQ